MTTASLPLLAIGLVLITVARAVFRRQSRAASCPLHSRTAGWLAVAAAWAALATGVIAVVAAVWTLAS